MKPSANETVLVRSLYAGWLPIGAERYVTPEEADVLIMIGRAELAKKKTEEPVTHSKTQPPYMHREMVAQRPQQMVRIQRQLQKKRDRK